MLDFARDAMNTCDTCKWWQDQWDEGNEGLCKNSKVYESEDAHVIVYADSQPIVTGSKFGCIHHESKP